MFLLRASTERGYGFRLTDLFKARDFELNFLLPLSARHFRGRNRPSEKSCLSARLVDKEHDSRGDETRRGVFFSCISTTSATSASRLPAGRFIFRGGLERVECVRNGLGPQSSRLSFPCRSLNPLKSLRTVTSILSVSR